MSSITTLWRAIEDRNAEKVSRLIQDEPALLEATDKYGFTPLMYAVSCMERDVAVIRVLIGAGASINRQTSEGYTALHCAIDVNGEANLNTTEVIGMLIEAGADLKLRQHYGWTPLLRAAVEGTLAEVKALLEGGADPNETMPFDTLPAFNAGRTTLMAAVTNPHSLEIVEALLRAGANPLMQDATGMTFFEYADLVQRESGAGTFSDTVQRCADLARAWTLRGA